MLERSLAAFVVACLWLSPAWGQSLFDNPLGDAAYYRSARASASEAQLRLRYEITRVERGGQPMISEMVIDVGPDWSVTREGPRVVLRDFRLNRVFVLGEDHFRSLNGLAELTFRIMERQNRSILQHVIATAGAATELPDACDAESELALVIPGSPDAGYATISERRGAVLLSCNEREIGGFTPGDGETAPSAFWPTMYSAMPTHPALHRRVRETGRAPTQMEISFRETGPELSRRTWRLVASEAVAIPYPLLDGLRNATAESLDQLVAGAGRAAAEAVAGERDGGAPTLQSWDHHLRALANAEGEAAAAMLLGNTYNMFPEIQCEDSRELFACALLHRVRALGDPGPWAVLEVAMAEQRGDNAAAIAAMQRAQSSPHRNHPALAASFALALLRFSEEDIAQARAANLPTDVAALQNRAIVELPYNPAYWTDVGDRFGRNYDWQSAFMFYDVAYSLPLPSAIARNQALVGKRAQMERIRRDFPDAFLSLSP